MLFYLTTLSLARFLTEEPLVLNENDVYHQSLAAIDAWKMLIFCVGIISSMDWAMHSTMCIVQSRPQRNFGSLWTSNTRLKMLAQRNLLLTCFLISR